MNHQRKMVMSVLSELSRKKYVTEFTENIYKLST